ncbi:hypothetical protein GCM10010168_35000 [Actinoplanes ianthinogenes]|uniref:Uncharacterized protein n=1 Tax=Actinoplanes ianthinogenes TaxID=122358 RepID=A0ABN6CP24_9ACTN|nr:hypothetical protein [Actinoplanes ianthinogenes]BCJ46980.1 hypothetical protein Aiant_76370 [Actinoplanes ianthinogenes]GGR14204.1 hypothetical protein GCM10010168_35000 [Actinoplanes ianthinogenes]
MIEEHGVEAQGRLVPAEDGDVLVSVSVGPAGEAVALWTATTDHGALTSVTTSPGWATFPDARAARPAGARVTVHTPDGTRVVRIPSMPLAHATAQPLPDGRILVVAARCRWRPDGPDHNAIVYDPTGAPVSRHVFGDGIEHVYTTPSGGAWAGYFDEGVYGNYGWAGPGPSPVGDCGLIRFGPDGALDWRFDELDDLPFIDDCYALNVTGETAWACYYSGFPLVRVQDGRATVWRNDLAHGARALLVGDGRVALAGGYRGDRDRLVVAELGDGVLHETGRYRLTLPGGDPLPDGARLVGRGPDLHVFAGPDWYRLRIDAVSGART